jgi:tetratricopeptide (TPR) repeat protein
MDQHSDAPAPRMRAGVLLVVALVAGAVIGSAVFLDRLSAGKRELDRDMAARRVFAPALDALAHATAAPAQLIDIDKTARTLHEIDALLEHSGSLSSYLEELGAQDYRGVAPDVLAARKAVLDVLFDLYRKNSEVEEHDALWKLSQRLFGAVSVLTAIDLDLDVPFVGRIGVDEAGARSILDEFKAREAGHTELLADVAELESRLIAVQEEYAAAYWRVIDDWDALCILRDRAYLAAWQGDWQACLEQSEAAIDMAPLEREAHLLQALALIEGGLDAPERPEVGELLGRLVDEHPQESAPALLLRGVWNARAGRTREARLDLEQAAALYPRQSQALASAIDPYNARTWLRASRSGNAIRQLYRATMLGAAWFSPELELARLDFAEGRRDEGRQRVMDHFFRRRESRQWDLVLFDARFCAEILGPDFAAILPEDSWLDLVVEPTLLGGALDFEIKNRSDRALHNATLVVLLQFTDMHRDDHEPFALETVPEIEAHATTSFGSLSIDFELGGAKKGRADVVPPPRALVVCNEAVLWVDTVEYKAAAARAAELEPAGPTQSHAGELSALEVIVDRALAAIDALGGAVPFAILDVPLLADGVRIELPRALAALDPAFRLRVGGDVYEAGTNELEGGSIVLEFDRVGDLGADPAGSAVLEIESLLADIALTFERGADGAWRLAGVEHD